MLEPNKPSFDFTSPVPPSNTTREEGLKGEVSPNTPPWAMDNALYNPPQFDSGTGQMPPQQQQQQQIQGVSNEPIYKGTHPFAAFFHIAFKIGALLTFILGGIFSSSYVTIFVITILLLAADFWTTKNVSGRLLVSLRWWNEEHEDGTSHWIFESAPDVDQRVNAFDKWFFWITTGGNCVAWALMVFFNLMSPSRLPMALAGAILGGVNFFGFLKCSREASRQLANYVLTRTAQQPELVRQVANAL